MTISTTAPSKLAQRDPLIIGLCGLARSGKTTAAAWLEQRYGFAPVAFADTLRDMLESHFAERGIDHAWLHEPQLKELAIAQLQASGPISARMLMQTLGDWGRSLHPDWWVHALAQRIGLSHAPGSTAQASNAPVHDRIVVSDVRYPNEAAWLKQHGGLLIQITRTTAPTVRSHSSENHAHSLGPHITLVNDSASITGLHQMLDGALDSHGIAPRTGF